MFAKKSISSVFSILLIVLLMSSTASARPLNVTLGTGFTYQGKLSDGGAPANGAYDFEFTLYDALSDGSQVGSTVTQGGVTVTDSLFMVQLDFGDVFDGTALFLSIGVKPGGSVGTYTTLTPRQQMTATPSALYASKAPWSGLTGVPAGFADDTDDNTTYTAGSGLALNSGAFSVTGAPWSGLTGVPAGFADNTDDNTTYTAGSGLALNSGAFSVTGAPWSGLTDVPAGFADGVDNDSSYQNLVIVAKSGGNFTTITDALNSITEAAADNHYLIYVAPGTYIEQVTMKQYVDIEGAGELATKITSLSRDSENTGTLVGANDAELRFLTVENTGGKAYAVAIFIPAASLRLTKVSASASGGVNYNYGVYSRSSLPTMTNVSASASGGMNSYGVYNWVSSSTMTNVTATASGGTENRGVYNYQSSPMMTHVTASASGGTYNYGVYNLLSSLMMTNATITASGGTFTFNFGVNNNQSSSTINNSVISASDGSPNYGIYNLASTGSYTVQVNNSQVSGSTNTISNDSEFTTQVGASKMDGGGVTGGGTVTCAGVYDENYAFYASTCP